MSKEPRILNLDDFAMPETKFIYEGEEYEVELMSTEAYLRFLQGREEAEKAKTTEEEAEVGVKLINMAVPSFPKEKAMKMSLPQMLRLVRWISEVMEGDTKNVAAAVEETTPSTSPDSLPEP